jgi:hypothetical protein
MYLLLCLRSFVILDYYYLKCNIVTLNNINENYKSNNKIRKRKTHRKQINAILQRKIQTKAKNVCPLLIIILALYIFESA